MAAITGEFAIANGQGGIMVQNSMNLDDVETTVEGGEGPVVSSVRA